MGGEGPPPFLMGFPEARGRFDPKSRPICAFIVRLPSAQLPFMGTRLGGFAEKRKGSPPGALRHRRHLCTTLLRPTTLIQQTKGYSAELSHSLTSFGSWWKHPDTGPKSIGICLCRFVGTAPGIFGLVSSGLGADLGRNSTNFGRILNKFSGLF